MLVFFYVARNTLRECLREPIFLLLLSAAAFLIGLFPSLSLYVFREQIKLVVDSSMATTMVFGLFAAVISASHTISREMKNGTVLVLLSKPVSRWNFVLAKVAGIIAALTIFVLVCNLASLISVKVAKDQFQLNYGALYSYYGMMVLAYLYGGLRNYFNQKSFSAEAISAMLVLFSVCTVLVYFFNREIPGENTLELRYLLPALTLLFFAVWAMGAITIAISTRLDMLPNMMICSALFLLGLVSDYYFSGQASKSILYSIVYAAIPNWQLFWLADALASRREIPIEYVLWAAAYVLLYICFCSSFAILMFADKEISESIT